MSAEEDKVILLSIHFMVGQLCSSFGFGSQQFLYHC